MRFILLVVLIDMLAVGLIVPVLPALVGQFTADPAEQTYWFGWVTFSYALASFISAPVLGALSDRLAAGPCCCWAFAAWR
jgi:DHA1 family tetracycline resistance protein-like MFS transporter